MSNPNGKQDIFPVYLVVDTSGSMTGTKIDAANELVPAIIDAARRYASVADSLRVSLITFDSAARTIIPMSHCDDITVPTLVASGGTSYASAFREVSSVIARDVAQLKADEHRVLRPSVFVLTDDDPGDSQSERDAAWAELTDKSRREFPNVTMFGIGDHIDTENLSRYVHHKGQAFRTRTGADARNALESIIHLLVMSVVASGNNPDPATTGLTIDTSAIDDNLEVM